jgi:hypothetical protein
MVSPINVFSWRNEFDEKYYEVYNDNILPDHIKLILNTIVLKFDKEFKKFMMFRNYKKNNTYSISTNFQENNTRTFVFNHSLKYLYNKKNSGKYVAYAEQICNNLTRHIHKYSNSSCSFIINEVCVSVERPNYSLFTNIFNWFFKIIFGNYIKLLVVVECNIFSSTEIIL